MHQHEIEDQLAEKIKEHIGVADGYSLLQMSNKIIADCNNPKCSDCQKLKQLSEELRAAQDEKT